MKVSRKDFRRIVLDDTDPDLSHLGKYTNEISDDAFCRRDNEQVGKLKADSVVTDEDGNEDQTWEPPERSREYRFFLPALTGEDTGNPDSPKQDFERMEAYNRGEWNMVGIRAQVVLRVPIGNGIHKLQPIESGALWGIASDSGESYFDEVYRDKCAQLEQILTVMGLEVID